MWIYYPILAITDISKQNKELALNLETLIHLRRTIQPLWFRILTWPLSWIFFFCVRCRNFIYDREMFKIRKLDQPVVSIGNLHVGGTGKSPLVISLCEYLISRGKRPAILTRGYGTILEDPGWMAVKGHAVLHGQKMIPDEAAMEAAMLPTVPIVIGPQRFIAASEFQRLYPNEIIDVWVLEDGFQHRQIHRDVDIVCADAKKRFCNPMLLPAGPLRESIEQLRRAHGLIFTRSQVSKVADPFLVGNHPTPTYEISFSLPDPIPLKVFFEQKRQSDPANPTYWAVACGIAQPERFTNSLIEKGMKIKETLYFQDHQKFDGKKFADWIEEISDDKNFGLLVTAKDAYRNQELLLSLQVPIYIQPLSVNDSPIVWKSLLAPIL